VKDLAWLLRHGAVSKGLKITLNGYVRVQDVLSYRTFRGLDLVRFIDYVQRSPSNIFKIMEDYDVRGSTKIWWVRATRKHTIEGVNTGLKQILSSQNIPAAVYGTTFESWLQISQHGLQKGPDGLIHLSQRVIGDNVLEGRTVSSQILIYLDVEKALASRLRLYLTDKVPRDIVTQGDFRGVIRPTLFKRVVEVKVKKRLLFQRGDDERG